MGRACGLTGGWRSADGGVSAGLSDGRVLWFFGDTVKMPDAPGPTMVGNSMLMSTGSRFVQVTRSTPGAVFADETKAGVQTVVWPTGVVTLDRGTWDEVWVFGNRVRRSGVSGGSRCSARRSRGWRCRTVVPRGCSRPAR